MTAASPSSPFPSLADLAHQLASGQCTSLQLTETALARAQNPDGEGPRTFTRLNEEQALACARASDTLRAAGIIRSPLEGIPVSVKDLFDIAGQPTTAGSLILRDAPTPSRNAPIIDRLITAGAVIVGRTNMTEFAFSGLGINPHYGTPRNPWNRAGQKGGLIPGGSSSGAAISVTDGMAALAIGSDTGGSVRIPAALCGLTGFKPTRQRVPTEGVLPLSTSLDSIGPLGVSVRCCAVADAILANQPQPRLRSRSLSSIRLLLPANVVRDDMDATVAHAFEHACTRLRASGADIHVTHLPELDELAILHAQGTLVGAEAWAWHRTLLQEHGSSYDPRVRSRIEAGSQMQASSYIDLLHARRRWIDALAGRLNGFDALVMPTVPIIAPRIDELQANEAAYFHANRLLLRNPSIINFLDGCALSLPCHRPGDPPVGIMLAAPAFNDHALLSLGVSVEEALLAGATFD